MIPHPDKIGNFHTETQLRVLFQAGDQEARCPFQRWVWQAQPRQPENRDIPNPKLRIFEIQLAGLGVMGGFGGADLPKWWLIAVADAAGRCCDLVEL